MIWAIYPRKSRENDSSVSMDMQIDICEKYIQRVDKKPIIRIYKGDYGVSGHSVKLRKDFQRMMSDAKNKQINAVAIYRYDRIARDMYAFVNLYHDLEEAGCSLVSVTENIDTTTPSGKMMMYQLAAFAEKEWHDNSTRRKDANKYAAAVGKCNLPPYDLPWGLKIERIDGMRKVVVDKEKKPYLDELKRILQLTKSKGEATRRINELYNLNISRSVVNSLLNSNLYHGEYRGNKNYCEAYMTEEEQLKLRESCSYTRHYSDDKRYYLFTGLLRCPECGKKMEGQSQTNTSGRRYYYYRCYAPNRTGLCHYTKNINEKSVESFLLDNIEEFVNINEANYSAKIKSPKPQKEKVDYSAELQRLTNAYIKGRLSEKDYDTEYERITKLIESNNNQEEKTIDYDAIKNVFSKGWKEIYNELTRENKRAFWREIIDHIEITEEKEIKAVYFL